MSKGQDLMELNSIMMRNNSSNEVLKDLIKFMCKQLIEIKGELRKLNGNK